AADIQRKHTFCAGFLKRFGRFLHRSLITGDHDLSRTVIVGDPYALTAFQNLLNGRTVHAKNCRHASLSCRNSFLHQDSSFSNQPHGIGKFHSSCGHNRAVFAKAQSCRHLRSHTLFTHHALHRHTRSQQGDLCVFRNVQFIIFLKTEFLHIQSQQAFCLIEHFSGTGGILIKIFSHPRFLCALSRENKCYLAHGPYSLSSYKSRKKREHHLSFFGILCLCSITLFTDGLPDISQHLRQSSSAPDPQSESLRRRTLPETLPSQTGPENLPPDHL